MTSKISNIYTVRFIFDHRGYGSLMVFKNDKIHLAVESRTGSIGVDGKLKNSIPIQPYYLCSAIETPVPEEKDLMYIPHLPGLPFKHRLNPYVIPEGHDRVSSILIHPDGGKGGTKGCVGTLDNAINYYDWAISYFIGEYEPVKVVVGQYVRGNV